MRARNDSPLRFQRLAQFRGRDIPHVRPTMGHAHCRCRGCRFTGGHTSARIMVNRVGRGTLTTCPLAPRHSMSLRQWEKLNHPNWRIALSDCLVWRSILSVSLFFLPNFWDVYFFLTTLSDLALCSRLRNGAITLAVPGKGSDRLPPRYQSWGILFCQQRERLLCCR